MGRGIFMLLGHGRMEAWEIHDRVKNVLMRCDVQAFVGFITQWMTKRYAWNTWNTWKAPIYQCISSKKSKLVFACGTFNKRSNEVTKWSPDQEVTKCF